MNIRFARPEDSKKIREIYAHYIETPITFECVLPSEREFDRRITQVSDFYPYLVSEGATGIVGYAYAHRHMRREAYQWNAELSIYLEPGHTSQGLGKRMYGMLIDILRLQGVRTVYGGVTTPNEKSELLHAALGFQVVGTYHKAGFKAGKWHDVTWFEKPIAEYGEHPQPIVSINDLPQEQLQKILSPASANRNC